jgi:hypothetical protein
LPYAYTLSETIPFLRLALQNGLGGPFTFPQFVDALWIELEKVNVPDVVRVPPHENYSNTTFKYSQSSRKLQFVTAEAFQYLQRTGFIVPLASDFPRVDQFGFYLTATPSGAKWAAGGTIPPEDEVGYLAQLVALVPKPNPVVVEYVREALRTLERDAYLAAAVMLGAACEAAIYDLADALLVAIVPGKNHNDLEKLSKQRRLFSLLVWIAKFVETQPKIQQDFNGAQLHLASLFDSIRIQRNEAVHPKTGAVSLDSLRLAFDAFPRAYQASYRLIEWLAVRPNSLN